MDKENESIQLNHVYQLSQAIQVSIKLQNKDNQNSYGNVLRMGRELFNRIKDKAVNMDQLKLVIAI